MHHEWNRDGSRVTLTADDAPHLREVTWYKRLTSGDPERVLIVLREDAPGEMLRVLTVCCTWGEAVLIAENTATVWIGGVPVTLTQDDRGALCTVLAAMHTGRTLAAA